MVSLARLCGIFPRFPKKQALRLRNGETTNTVARCEISVSRRVGNCEIEPQVAAFLQGFRGRNESQAGERETFDFGTRGTSLPKKVRHLSMGRGMRLLGHLQTSALFCPLYEKQRAVIRPKLKIIENENGSTCLPMGGIF